MITAALEGQLDKVEYETHPVFGMAMPKSCPGVPSEILNPRNTWPGKDAYDEMAGQLAGWFISNFAKYAAKAFLKRSWGPHLKNNFPPGANRLPAGSRPAPKKGGVN